MSIKMSEVFSLPMLCEEGDGYLYSRDCRHSIRFDDTDTNCMDQKSIVSEAINAYDDNQTLIASQAETIDKQQDEIALLKVSHDNGLDKERHDEALIAKQQEQLTMVRDALKEIVELQTFDPDDSHYMVNKAEEALEATKEIGA